MGFGNDLFTEFNHNIVNSKKKINEITLFEALAESIVDIVEGSPKCKAIMIPSQKCKAIMIPSKSVNRYANYQVQAIQKHGKKVVFKEKQGIGFYYSKDQNNTVCCEIADLMFIVYDKKKKRARLCFMQNKYEKKMSILMT